MTQHTNATSCQKRVRTVGYTTVAEVQVTSSKTCSYTLLLPASKEVAKYIYTTLRQLLRYE